MNSDGKKRIKELVENINGNLERMRSATPEEVMKLVNRWEETAKEAIRELNQTDIENINLISEITDNLYRKAVNFEIIDTHTNGYLAIVANRIFWELSQKKCRIFYILDNSLRDDRLKFLLEHFPPAGFVVVTPHIAKDLEYKPETTQTDNVSLEEIESKISNALSEGKNIIYIERDSSVNYLHNVMVMALNASEEYAKVLRNKGSENPEFLNVEEIEMLVYNK